MMTKGRRIAIGIAGAGAIIFSIAAWHLFAPVPHFLGQEVMAISWLHSKDRLKSFEVMKRISRRSDVAFLVSLINLERKGPCACIHLDRIVFQTRQGEIEASVCNHCFDVENQGLFKMPSRFYREFCRLCGAEDLQVDDGFQIDGEMLR